MAVATAPEAVVLESKRSTFRATRSRISVTPISRGMSTFERNHAGRRR